MAFLDKIKALLGVSAYEPPKGYGPELDSASVEAARRSVGGMIQPIPSTRLRWYLSDLEVAQAEADAGNLNLAGQLHRAMRRDGVLAGLMATRTMGLVRLPRRFYGGQPEIVDALRENNGSRSVFDELCPPSELSALAWDGVDMGVGVGELVPVPGRSYPVLVRLDPQWLYWRWSESRWYYQSRAGLLPVTPGNGRWVLHVPGGRVAPWQWGLWPALGRAFIAKEHAFSMRANVIAGVANPAKVLQAPSGATEQQRRAMFKHLLHWGPNMAVELPVGWELKILELVGKNYEIFQREIDTSDLQYMIAIAGQEVTTTGGAGFSNADVHRAIRGDLIKADADALAYTINSQVIPQYAWTHFGGDAAVDAGTSVEWDADTPKDQSQTASMLVAFATAAAQLAALYPNLSLDELAARFGIPLSAAPEPAVTELRMRLAAANTSDEDGSVDVDMAAE